MTLVDGHVHLMEYIDPAAVVEGSPGVCMFSCTINAGQAEANMKLKRDARVRAFLGVHPSDVTDALPSEQLSPFLEACDGIGEIGLDPKYSEVGRGSDQMRSFLDQLSAAERLGKPVEVHTRGSEKLCLEVLGSFRLRSVLLHWFEGEEEAETAASRGYYFSFGPALLYSKKLRRVAERVPAESILTESDGPVPFNAIGGGSGPNLVASALFRLGEVRGLSFSDTETTVEENALRFLGAERLI